MNGMSEKRLTLGVCYYPEHWSEKVWDSDLSRMEESGIAMLRIGEFAWALLEPEEDRYDFSLFDRFLALVEKHNLKVIFGTPTATPPIWLTEKYPEVLNARVDGTLYRHGLRRHYNYNSPVYLEKCDKIVQALGEHYGNRECVIGWQIDNELNCETNRFYSKADHVAFRNWMQRKFGSLENLNEATGGNVWSQIYTDWSQVSLQQPTVNDEFNPHILLQERLFVSDSAVAFCRRQCRILRPLIGSAFITTNGIFADVDYRQLLSDGSLDFISYDSYPNFAFDMYAKPDSDPLFRDRKWSRNLTMVRAVSGKFGIMEQQAGANGWTGRMEAPMPKPGQLRLWSMQSVAHGADFVSYFRWRTAPYGTEIYWHGILDYDGHENRRIREVRKVRDDFAKLEGLRGERYLARVACIRTKLNDADVEVDAWHARLDRQTREGIFEAAQLLHEPLDEVFLDESTTDEKLDNYQLLICPHLAILSQTEADCLYRYARRGGRVVFTCRTGYKDEYGRCPMIPMGGAAAEMCGARIEEYTFVGPLDEKVSADWNGTPCEMVLFNEVPVPADEDTKIEAVYTGSYYKDSPAVVSRKIGKGDVWYFGAALSRNACRVLLEKLDFGEPCGELIDLPDCCELSVRGDYLFVLNYAPNPVTIHLKTLLYECIGEREYSGEVVLSAYDCMIFHWKRK